MLKLNFLSYAQFRSLSLNFCLSNLTNKFAENLCQIHTLLHKIVYMPTAWYIMLTFDVLSAMTTIKPSGKNDNITGLLFSVFLLLHRIFFFK